MIFQNSLDECSIQLEDHRSDLEKVNTSGICIIRLTRQTNSFRNSHIRNRIAALMTNQPQGAAEVAILLPAQRAVIPTLEVVSVQTNQIKIEKATALK